MNSLWETPSCSKFLHEICYELWNGNIILVFLPKHSPDRFLRELKMLLAIEKGQQISYRNIDLKGANCEEEKPIESFLSYQLEINVSSNVFGAKRVSEIFKAIPINANEVIVFENFTSSILNPFKEFLTDLGRYFTGIQVHKRHKIIALIDPEVFSPNIFNNEPGTSKQIFKGIISNLDQALALRFVFEYDKQLNQFSENLIITLAQYDFVLADNLYRCDNLLTDYAEVLSDYAHSCKWKSIEYKKVEYLNDDEVLHLWSKGIIDISNGRPIYHSAFLKIHNQDSELDRRIWKSCIQILYPMIEEFRGKFINHRKIILPNQIEKIDRIVEDKNEFEITDLVRHMDEIVFEAPIKYDRAIIKEFTKLSRTIRNDLSHLRIPSNENIYKFLIDWDDVLKILEN